MLKTETKQIVKCSDFDRLVTKTYGKPYCYQQQDNCKDRGTEYFSVPSEWTNDEGMNDSIPEKVNGNEMGVKFSVWLNTDPNTHKENNNWEDFEVGLFWERNFYPDFGTLVNDLHAKGLIEAGEYAMKIDW